MENCQSFDFTQDFKKYKINSKLIEDYFSIEVKESEDTLNCLYKLSFTLDQLKEQYKQFKAVKSLQQFKEKFFDKSVKNKDLKILKKEDRMTLILNSEGNSFEFGLKFTWEDSSQIIYSLIHKVKSLEKENQFLMEEVKRLDEVKQNKQEFGETLIKPKTPSPLRKSKKKTSINQMLTMPLSQTTPIKIKGSNTVFNTSSTVKDNTKPFLTNSTMVIGNTPTVIEITSKIMEEGDLDLIKEAIKNKMNKKIIKIKKIYDGRLNGDEAFDFHSYCDKIPNTLTVIKAKEKYKFGGFTTQTWDGYGFKDDLNAFVFSLKEKKVFDYLNDGKAIWCDKNYGPIFGGGFDIGIGNSFMTSVNSYTATGYPGHSYDGDDYQLGPYTAKKRIQINELEVFQLTLGEI